MCGFSEKANSCIGHRLKHNEHHITQYSQFVEEMEGSAVCAMARPRHSDIGSMD